MSDADDDALVAAQQHLLLLANGRLDEALSDLGLYVNEKQIVVREGALPAVSLRWTGVLGRVAFSDRVLNPEAVTVADEFDEIATALSDEAFEERRRRLLGNDD